MGVKGLSASGAEATFQTGRRKRQENVTFRPFSGDNTVFKSVRSSVDGP